MADDPRKAKTGAPLARPSTIRLLWIGGFALLALTVLADLAVEHHPYFEIEHSYSFGAWFGFAACAALVVLATGLGLILRRRDGYYDD